MVLLVLAMAWKEDVSLLVVGLGVPLPDPGPAPPRRSRDRRRPGVVRRHRGVARAPRRRRRHGVRRSLRRPRRHPGRGAEDRAQPTPTGSCSAWPTTAPAATPSTSLAPFGFTPLAAPEVLLLGLPQALVNLLSTANFTWDLRYHYQALPMVALGIAMVEGVARLRRWAERRRLGDGPNRFTVGFACACALAATDGLGAVAASASTTAPATGPSRSPADVAVRDRMVARIGPARRRERRLLRRAPPHPPVDRLHVPEPVGEQELRDHARRRWATRPRCSGSSSTRRCSSRPTSSSSTGCWPREFVVRDQQGTVVLAERVRPPVNPRGPP